MEPKTSKVCTGCKLELPIDRFRIAYEHNGSTYRSRCMECDRVYSKKYAEDNKEARYDYHLQRQYGVTLEEYNDLYEFQGGVCAICMLPEKRRGSNGKIGKRGPKNEELRKLAVDHDHETGQVRALLCHDCNVALGLLNHDVNLYKRHIAYIEEFAKIR